MSDTPKPPPSWLIDGVGRVRAGLGLLHRSAVPPKVALLEIAQGAWLSQAMYVSTKLGIADALRQDHSVRTTSRTRSARMLRPRSGSCARLQATASEATPRWTIRPDPSRAGTAFGRT